MGGPALIIGAQVRAARALLGWSQSQLAEFSNVGLSTIQRMEKAHGIVSGSAENAWRVQKSIEIAGVEFISTNGGGPGVRFRDPQN